jgi:tape measure domain-containing protein
MSRPLSRIGSGIDKLTRKQVRPATEGFKKLETQSTSTGRSLGGLGVKGVAIGSLIADGAARALGAIVDLGKGAIATVIEFTTFAENSELAFNALAKHGASGAKLFERARNLAVEFGMDVQDTTGNFKKLLAAQFNPELASDIIRMGADLRVIGAGGEDVAGAIRAITQIKGTGILQGDELNQLANAGVSIDLIRQKMQKLLGVSSNAEVLKLQEGGKIDADTAISAILQAVQEQTGSKVLGEAGKRFADTTLTGMAGRLKARGQNLMVSLGEQMVPQIERAIGPIAAKLDAFLTSPEGQQAIDRLATGLGQAFEFIGKLIEKVTPIAQRFFKGFGGELSKDLPKMGESLDRFLSALAKPEVAKAAESWGKRLGMIVGMLGKLTTLVLEILPALFRLGDAIQKPFDVVRSAASKVIDAAATWGPRIIDGLVSGLEAGITKVSDVAGRVGAAIMGKLGKIFNFGSPSKAMEEKGTLISLGLRRGIESIDVGSAIDRLARGSVTLAANDNAVTSRAQAQVGPVASSFADRPRAGDMAPGGSSVSVRFAPVFQITQQPGQSSAELADDLEVRVRRALEDEVSDLARTVGAA